MVGVSPRGLVLDGDVCSDLPWGAPHGVCRLCGGTILRPDGAVNLRRRWHQLCSDYFTLATNLRHALAAFRRLDGRLRCYACGHTEHEWPCREYDETVGCWVSRCDGEHRGYEIDHIVPLWAGGSHGFANLQPLCYPCHRDKTVREAALRAARRRRTADAAFVSLTADS
jgi:5-methylcytosine-specific restriction endonuclease McrA